MRRRRRRRKVVADGCTGDIEVSMRGPCGLEKTLQKKEIDINIVYLNWCRERHSRITLSAKFDAQISRLLHHFHFLSAISPILQIIHIQANISGQALHR